MITSPAMRKSIRDLYSEVHTQVQKGIEHSCYPYVDKHNTAGGGESAYLLYQQDIRNVGGLDGMNIEAVDIRQNQAASQTILDMQILDGKKVLMLVLDYAASRYEKQSMEKYQSIFIKIAQSLVAKIRRRMSPSRRSKRCSPRRKKACSPGSSERNNKHPHQKEKTHMGLFLILSRFDYSSFKGSTSSGWRSLTLAITSFTMRSKVRVIAAPVETSLR